MNARHVKLSIIVTYAPIENADEEDKDDFYYSLQMTVDDVPRHDLMLLLRDPSERVGCYNKNRERVMEKYGVGCLTNNGERVINPCEENNLIIGGILFTHRNLHILTWASPVGRTRYQIDHIITNGKWRGSLQDVLVMRTADVGSHHNLLWIRLP